MQCPKIVEPDPEDSGMWSINCSSSSPVNTSTRTLISDDDDEGLAMNDDWTMGSPISRVRPHSPSPPSHRIRALKLFDSPRTPATLVHESRFGGGVGHKTTRECGGKGRTTKFGGGNTLGLPRTILFGTPRPDSTTPDDDKPAANVNPFIGSKKRTRGGCDSPGSECTSPTSDTSFTGEQPAAKTKRITLRDSNISRYSQEFHELQQIGSGQFGSVYKCLNRLNGCVYAVKRSTKPVAGSNLEKAALNEVYAHAVLGGHKHVVRYFSAWAERDHMYIQNEYCDGGSLADRIANRGGCLSRDEVMDVWVQVAKGLYYIHNQGLAHLDIKPGNVFISTQGAPEDFPGDDEEEREEPHVVTTYKIGDLGHVTSVTMPEVGEEGDCRYLATEVLQGDYSNLTKADILALGLSVIECAGGGPLPKNGPHWHALRDGNLPPLRTKLDLELVELLREMIGRQASARPSASDVLRRLYSREHGGFEKGEWAKINHELNAYKLKSEILQRKWEEAMGCIKTLTPNGGGGAGGGKRVVVGGKGKKGGVVRSFSTTTF